MKVLLIDADSTIPNLALMKLSSHHKRVGDKVDMVQVHLPYYPSRKKFDYFVPDGYDKVYCSVVFQGNKEHIIGRNIEFGGTGVSLEKKLSDEVERMDCDYTLYPDNDTSYGFITRGCIRNCYFCFVPKKEGMIHKVNNINDIIRHKKVKFMDNNILAYEKHKGILQELVDKQTRCQFNQGLDIRLVDKENSELLSKMNYLGEYIFAFDDWAYVKLIEKKLPLLGWRKDYQFKFFVYVNPEMDFSNFMNRLNWMREHKCLPYFMRDIACWASDNSNFYTDLASYCNQPSFWKKMPFEEFLNKRYKNKERIKQSWGLYKKYNGQF